VLQTT